MKFIIKVLCSIVLLSFLISNNIFEFSEYKAEAAANKYKTTTSLNLRAGAGKNYKVLLVIPNKTQITVTSTKNVGGTTWYKTTYKKKTGWVSGKYLVKVTPPAKDKFNLTTKTFYKNIYTIKNPSNTLVLVNKNNKLSKNYVPSNLRVVKVARRSDDTAKMNSTAAKQLEKMFADAKKDGIELAAWSGYRSYKTQQAAYNQWKKNDSISARPGHSEHQTGLAMDVIAKKDLKKNTSPLTQSFGKTKEGKWIAANAYKYGFIIRYPKGKEKITGYSYEPWHIRYVGEKVATKLYENNWTLEEAYIEGYLK